MSKTFTRIGKDIVIAIKEGGPDPESNSRLRAVMQNARAANMPKDNVLRAIKKATDKDTAEFKESTFEGYAPHGVAVFIETASDNNNRTVANIRSYFNKNGGSLGVNGSVSFMFDRVSHFKITKPEMDLEELELELIDAGAEELFDEEETVMIYGSFESFGALQSTLEEKGFEIVSSGFDRLPQTTKTLTPDQVADVEKLLEKIEEDDDVQNVFHTMAESSD